MRVTTIALAAAGALSLSACGYNQTDRALSGAGIGAATGAAGSAVLGASVVTGAAVGAATGAAVGVLTRPDQIDLGR